MLAESIMSNTIKPIPAEVSNTYATKAPRIRDGSDKNQRVELEIKDQKANDSGEVVDKETLEVRRTFRDASQAYSAYKRLKQQNVERNRKNALIQKKLNNEPPYSPKKLESMGQNWRSNRPTGFLSILISRIQPPFVTVIDAASTLTYSKYPINSVDAEQKTKVFREEITKTIRGWSGNNDLLAQIVHENTTFGFTAMCWDDTRDWKPEFLRQDYTFFSIETPQNVDATPIWARKRRYQIAELLPILEDAELSALAGWHIKNLVKAINNARPAGRTLDSDDDARRYEDWMREGSYGASYENDAKYVELGELLVKEPTGKISRFLFDDKTGDEICSQLDRYNRMSDCLALFAIEVGSGSLMSSRGAGRDLYNTHIAVDKARNLIIDNTYLRGMLLLRKTATAKNGVAPLTVNHPVAFISEGYEVVQQQMPADVEDFIRLDQFVSGLAEIQVGTFLPSSAMGIQTGDKTASEINRVAAIENQIREGILSRWAFQYSQAVQRMQRGICHPEHIRAASEIKTLLDVARIQNPAAVWGKRDVVEAFFESELEVPSFVVPFEIPRHLDEDAIDCCLRMLERNLPPSDILLMAYSPAQELLPDMLAQDNAILDLLIQRYMGNPSINQAELMKLDWSRKVGQEIANSVLVPPDMIQANAIEATRQQVIELQSIMAGQEVPVSPRDDDDIHLQTLTQKLMPVIVNAPEGSLPPEMVQPFTRALQHYMTHLQQAEGKGMDKKKLQLFKEGLKMAYDKLTAGMNVPPVDQVIPAVAGAGGGGRGGGGRRPSVAQANMAGEALAASSPSQLGEINQVAAPGKPPTAA
jgi:hypothetical protein